MNPNTAPAPTGATATRAPSRAAEVARIASALVCVWLILSAFTWPHSQAQLTNTWIVGAAGVVMALVADQRLWLAHLALAAWLFASVWLLPEARPEPIWNNAIAAAILFLLALLYGKGVALDRT